MGIEKPNSLKDGFYIAVRASGQETWVKLRYDSRAEMEEGINRHAKSKEVDVLGEYKNNKQVKKDR